MSAAARFVVGWSHRCFIVLIICAPLLFQDLSDHIALIHAYSARVNFRSVPVIAVILSCGCTRTIFYFDCNGARFSFMSCIFLSIEFFSLVLMDGGFSVS